VVTKPKDLRTGRSVWQGRRARPVPHRPLRRDIETDVLVIGAGITGAMISDALSGRGLKVVIADKRGPAKGSTAASTAMVLYEIDTPLTKLARKIGKPDATRAWRRTRLAVDAIAARLGELGAPDVTPRDSLYLAGDVLDADGLAREHDARRAAGLASRFLDRRALRSRFGIGADAAIMGYGDIAIDPRQTTLALLQAASEQGTAIYAPVEIVDIDAKKSRVIVTAANGRRIRSRHLVFASGYEFPDQVPRKGHQINSTWAIATVAQPRRLWPGQCMIWEASDPYLYVRTTPEGRVICGGEDEAFSDTARRDALLTSKTKTLQRKLGRLMPQLDTTVEFAWTGLFGESATGLPTIGQAPDLPNCWVALGYGGNGITYSRVAADIIAGALTGRPDIDADLFDFTRKRA
jgi:glycine/D-amino acid oxidase-like deaminating enzyme